MHLDSTSHQQKLSTLPTISRQLQYMSAPVSELPEKNMEAVTSVFWDIRTCPVPPGCDHRRVGPCIKRFLGNKGYSGPLTITAIGSLTDFPRDFLEEVYSSGVSLHNAFGETAFVDTLDGLIIDFTFKNEPPANIMVISDGKYFTSKDSFKLESTGYTIMRSNTLPEVEDDLEVEEVETSESAFWICSVCDMDTPSQGFKSFINHVHSRQHQQELREWVAFESLGRE
ncbi:PREDICTED: uncharacterized protein LOC104754390 [Camelina sativa]|uniref:Uncharacterized protein LOC104754390 n=1 Tax=Camelina sativa TaxID=90675 RepID=A0ABM0WQW2_CAMSA|nr:PREDICTED: uncharacterized protein LOC104754390 [Camelina sativa]XP_010474877.1 PREDICTED: uncharacterized protein LOC104754390 [Camelina sativa]